MNVAGGDGDEARFRHWNPGLGEVTERFGHYRARIRREPLGLRCNLFNGLYALAVKQGP